MCSISIEGDNAKPTRVIRCISTCPMISPDEKYAVWSLPAGPAELVELSNGKIVARWIGFFPNWSPDGKRIIFSCADRRYDDGVWIYDIDKGKTARIIEDWECYRCSWTPNSGQVAFSPLVIFGQTPNDEIRSGIVGGIWIESLDYSNLFGTDSSVLVRDWLRWEDSDAYHLMLMACMYKIRPERTADAEQVTRRLIEVLQQAIASEKPDSIQSVKWLAEVYLWLERYDDAEHLYLQAREKYLAASGAKDKGFLDLTEELVRFYLDVVNRRDDAEPLCVELSKTRQDVLGEGNSSTIRTRILLARIYERQKRYREAEQIYLGILNLQPGEYLKESTPEVYESIIGRLFLESFAPLSYFLDERSLVLRLLEEPNTGTAKDKLWPICAHTLLAKLYTTCPAAEIHNVTKAMEHGTTACELSGWAEPICLDALAAACAEAGRFDMAVQRQKEAVERLSGIKELMAPIFVNRLTMYEHGVVKPPRGLVARWEFEQSKDGVIPDTSGNGLHGRLVGDAQVYADSERGNVLRLDGKGDWVDCGADTKFDITDEITLSVWIKVARFDTKWQAVITKGISIWRLDRNGTTDTLEFNCGGVTTPLGTSSYTSIGGHVNVNDGKWHHITGVYDGCRISLFIDGERDASLPTLAYTRIATYTDPVRIGMNSGGYQSYEWNGLIDDVRIYSYALSPEDIKSLYEGKEPLRKWESDK
jgi:tetratricopeptide (TPR) repeat protein